ncbi:uncharacterized protein LOC130628478 isoform X2 [Hydractinia symbiolongicarpus]|uniref:uncharacterized protein LOC130628478 isoform X2 n=1 Tax=Hydractinia symbiolongicarpus TaxID=13093 RepID=UPI00254AB49F|nr:uncharacterized protein LOC130628478 isoform X2 [Hydractinia symbiolongicarpus]XP_057297433.1 uncharacterized protein LOC130628478 isoform X2 [Hydractinia symbiolongicarpus]
MANMKESKVPTKTNWRILCGALLSEVKNYLRSLLHHPANGNFPKDGGKLYNTILELYRNGEMVDFPIYKQTLIFSKKGISDSEIFDLYTLRCLLLKSKILKPDAVGAINNLCVMMNGIKYFSNVVPYYVMSNVVDQIKFGLSTLGCAKENMKEVEHLCTLFEDITLSEDELSTYNYEMHNFDCERQAELIFDVEECLRCLFHDPAYGDFPRDGKKLHQVMEEWQQQGKLKDLEKNLFSLLLPDSKITDSETFGIHLLGYFLCTNIKEEKRIIFDEIFYLTNQLIRYDKIKLRLDILSQISSRVRPMTYRYDVFSRSKENDLHKFAGKFWCK